MKTITALFVGLLLIVAIGSAQGQRYHVSTGGSDDNDGSRGWPWRTLAKAAATAAAGDTVLIMAGVFHERLLPQQSGRDGMFVTYASYPGDSATIDGTGIAVPKYSGLIDLAGRQYIRISGLRVANSNEAGILADGTSDIIIEGCSVSGTGSSGIGVWNSRNALIRGNRVERACTSGDQECISVAGTDSFIVRENVVLDCRKEGICLKDGSSNGAALRNHVHHADHVGIYVDAWDKHTFNIEVSGNLVHDIANKDGIMLASEQGGLLENARVINNISHSNGFDGIGISSCCPGVPRHPVRNVFIMNNTLFRNGTSGWGGGIGVQDNPDLDGAIIRNNICSQNESFQIAVDSIVPRANVSVDHNLIDGFRNEESEIRGDAAVEADPLFADTTALDFHLRPGSPAIDAGSPLLAPARDYDGNERPSGGGIDIGAFELSEPTMVDRIGARAPETLQLDQNHPNPFSKSTSIGFRITETAPRVAEDGSPPGNGPGSRSPVAILTFGVYDLLGREVLDLSHQLRYDRRILIHASQLPATGIYLYRLRVGIHVRTRAMLLVR